MDQNVLQNRPAFAIWPDAIPDPAAETWKSGTNAPCAEIWGQKHGSQASFCQNSGVGSDALSEPLSCVAEARRSLSAASPVVNVCTERGVGALVSSDTPAAECSDFLSPPPAWQLLTPARLVSPVPRHHASEVLPQVMGPSLRANLVQGPCRATERVRTCCRPALLPSPHCNQQVARC